MLHYAAANGNELMVTRILYLNDTLLTRKCKSGKTPAEYASANEHFQLYEFLQNQMNYQRVVPQFWVFGFCVNFSSFFLLCFEFFFCIIEIFIHSNNIEKVRNVFFQTLT